MRLFGSTIGPQATKVAEGLWVELDGGERPGQPCHLRLDLVLFQRRAGATTAAAIVVTCQGQAGIILEMRGVHQPAPARTRTAISSRSTAGRRRRSGGTGSVDTRNVLTGDQTVAFSGIAPNCQALTPTLQVIRWSTTPSPRRASRCRALPPSGPASSMSPASSCNWSTGTGQAPVPVPTFADPTDPAWSPDREWIAFSGIYTERIALIRPDGSDLHWLPATTRNAEPSFRRTAPGWCSSREIADNSRR